MIDSPWLRYRIVQKETGLDTMVDMHPPPLRGVASVAAFPSGGAGAGDDEEEEEEECSAQTTQIRGAATMSSSSSPLPNSHHPRNSPPFFAAGGRSVVSFLFVRDGIKIPSGL